jgi:alkylation response protein AidB-like acyl-CoA dehydrogenase
VLVDGEGKRVRYDASEDQQLLRETTRRFLEARSPVSEVRRLLEDPVGFDPRVWRQGAQLGWASMFVPEAFGGMAESASGAVDAALVAEELGRVVFAGPFLPTNVVAFAVAEAGTEAQRQRVLPALAGGELVATWCFAGTGLSPGTRPVGVRATTAGRGFVLTGESGYVQDAHVADLFLVTAATETGLSQFLVPAATEGISVMPLDALDLGRRLSDVRFDAVAVDGSSVVGAVDGAANQVERQLQLALVLQCAETVGVVDRVLEITVEYAKERVAFGRPIGSFQALKHRFADHAMWLEAAKAVTDHAAGAVQLGAVDAAIATSLAKSHVGRSATEITRDCVQIHGGIGVTWEHDLHLYVRRAVSNEALWGTPAAHHERLCDLAGV